MIAAVYTWVVALLVSVLLPVISSLVTLASLEQHDDHPFYTMTYTGRYETGVESAPLLERAAATGSMPWGCSLFAAFGASDGGPDGASDDAPDGALYGRNFDWQTSPAVLLFTDPPDGYASVSMVDIAYLVDRATARALDTAPLEDRLPLLAAPLMPFDGMNEHGLVVGMAAVPAQPTPQDPARPTVGSLGVIREMLDHARTVDEAVTILVGYNIDFSGGPPIHYLIADRAGRSVLAEFYDGELVLHPADGAWQVATNFLVSAVPEGDDLRLRCWRYRVLDQALAEADGAVSAFQAMSLLSEASQNSTQWSVVYGIETGAVRVALGGATGAVYEFSLPPAAE